MLSLRGAINSFQLLRNESGSAQSASSLLVPVLVVAAVFAALLRRQSAYSLADADHRSMLSRLPALPQSVLPIGVAYWLLNLPTVLIMLQGGMPEQEAIGPKAYLVGLAVAVPVLSYAALHLFSSRTRIEYNFPDVVLAEDFSALLWRRFLLTTAAMTLAVIILYIMEVYFYAGHCSLRATEWRPLGGSSNMRILLERQTLRLAWSTCIGILLPHAYWLLSVTGALPRLPGNMPLWLGYVLLAFGVVPVALLVWFATRGKVATSVALGLSMGTALLVLVGNYYVISWWYLAFFYRA